MKIQPFFDDRTATMTYIVMDEQTRDAVVIDPVLDYEPAASKIWTESSDVVIQFLKAYNLNLHYILETHAHADHLSGAQHIKKQYPEAKLVIGETIKVVQRTFKHIFGWPQDFATDGSQFDELFVPGEVMKAGSLEIKAIATPGHTPACLTFQIEDALFTGDALFMPDVGTGRCDFPAGSAEDLYTSVHDVLYAFPGETRVFTGHDYPQNRPIQWESTIAQQRETNVALPASRTRENFVEWRQKRDAGLSAPTLLFQSVQVNIDAGNLPNPEDNELRYLKIPINVFKPEVKPADLELDTAPPNK